MQCHAEVHSGRPLSQAVCTQSNSERMHLRAVCIVCQRLLAMITHAQRPACFHVAVAECCRTPGPWGLRRRPLPPFDLGCQKASLVFPGNGCATTLGIRGFCWLLWDRFPALVELRLSALGAPSPRIRGAVTARTRPGVVPSSMVQIRLWDPRLLEAVLRIPGAVGKPI